MNENKSCKDCYHYDVCFEISDVYFLLPYEENGKNVEKNCPNFKDKTRFVEVVRCKDCKHLKSDIYGGKQVGVCDLGERIAYGCKPNDFCSYGERKGAVQ